MGYKYHEDEMAYQRRYRAKNAKRLAENYREGNNRRRYGILEGEYQKLLVKQKFVCKICGAEEWESRNGRLHIDHCHKTAKVRGLLCFTCNVGIGNFKDSPILLMRAIGYLKTNA